MNPLKYIYCTITLILIIATHGCSKVQQGDVDTAARTLCAINALVSPEVRAYATHEGKNIEAVVNDLCYLEFADAGQ